MNRALKEWEQIQNMEWWKLYQAEIEKELQKPLTEFGIGRPDTMSDSYCRWLQGIYEGMRRAKLIPKRLLDRLNKSTENS